MKEINAVGQWKSIQISIEAGAGPTMGPGDLCQDFAEFVPIEAARDGVCGWARGDLAFPSSPSEGIKTFKVLIDNVPRSIALCIAPKEKPLIYVNDTDDKGRDTFSPSDGRATGLPQASGEMTCIQRT